MDPYFWLKIGPKLKDWFLNAGLDVFDYSFLKRMPIKLVAYGKGCSQVQTPIWVGALVYGSKKLGSQTPLK
jgi:hypothetical protein